MKNFNHFTKTLFFSAILVMTFSKFTAAQAGPATQEDSSAVRQTALDYIEGYYTGDVARMERAIHPDFNKGVPVELPRTGRTSISYTTYSSLIELTRAGTGKLADTARHIRLTILNLDHDVSNVKIYSANFIDFVQEAKIDGQWKILNVIFTAGTNAPPRLKGFDAESERPEVEKTAMAYLAGIAGADAGRLGTAIDPDFNKITLNPVPSTGKTMIRRQRYDAVIENALAGIGKQDEVYRNYKAVILDITDGIAVVRCENSGTFEFLQMYKGNGQWKVFNSIVRPNTSLTLAQAMTVTAGEPMPDFTLPVYGGGEFKLSDYKGKTVLLMFPRGWTGNTWCSYCPYQYLELEQLEKNSRIMAKNNLEIAFVMPYSSEYIKSWLEKFPGALKVVETLKNPQPQPAAGSMQAEYADWVKKNYPIVFDVKKDDPHKLIPVLIDEDRTLSRQLKIFTNFWDGVTSEQNIASVFIVDKNGILKFKYIGQMTEDRPSIDFLMDIIKNMD